MPKQIERIYPLRKTTSHKLQRQKTERAAIRERIESFDAAMKGTDPKPERDVISVSVVKDGSGGKAAVEVQPLPSGRAPAPEDVVDALIEAIVSVARDAKASRASLCSFVVNALPKVWQASK